jgi:hypothetical protein
MPLAAAHPLALQQLPDATGVFRLRSEGGSETIYVGAAPHGLRLEIERLARRINLRICPSSSDSLAVRLWQIHRESGRGFQVSGASVPSAEIALTLAWLRSEIHPGDLGMT